MTPSNWFKYDGRLTTIDLSTITSSSVTNIRRIFMSCEGATKIDIRGISLDNVINDINKYEYAFRGVPNNCEIIVKDNTAKTFITTNWSNLTNVKTLAEYEAE